MEKLNRWIGQEHTIFKELLVLKSRHLVSSDRQEFATGSIQPTPEILSSPKTPKTRANPEDSRGV